MAFALWTKVLHHRVALVLSGLFLVALIRTAWISDDAAITLRVVLNLLHGLGPTFNIDERVQAFTHPLWFAILTTGSFLLGNVFVATFVISVGISVLSFGLLLASISRNFPAMFVVTAAAILSKAFIDFSTSGLENPLSHLLLLFFAYAAFNMDQAKEGGMTKVLLIAGLIYLNRPDLLLIALPITLFLMIRSLGNPKNLLLAIAISSAPVVVWTAFSLFYYGFPFPNTAYAKLGTGIPVNERMAQGLVYLEHCLRTDPVTSFSIFAALVLSFFAGRNEKLLAAGVAAYLTYVVYIGGDFMEGRFLTAPFFVSLIILARLIPQKPIALLAMVPIFALGSVSFHANLVAGASFSDKRISADGIADERGFYFQDYSLFKHRDGAFNPPPWVVEARQVDVICGGLGFNSIMSGPGMHYIDECALADPLLARLPAKQDPDWRIGHFYRQLPTNYQKSIEAGENLLADRATHDYWEAIRIVTRAPLWDRERLAEIVRLNAGRVAAPDWELYRTGSVPSSTDQSVFERLIESVTD